MDTEVQQRLEKIEQRMSTLEFRAKKAEHRRIIQMVVKLVIVALVLVGLSIMLPKFLGNGLESQLNELGINI